MKAMKNRKRERWRKTQKRDKLLYFYKKKFCNKLWQRNNMFIAYIYERSMDKKKTYDI